MSVPAQVELTVDGSPPAKNTDLSSFGARHSHYPRIVALLKAAAAVVGTPVDERAPTVPVSGPAPIILDVEQYGPSLPPGDSTNYVGGIADVLESKDRRATPVTHLGALARVALYDNDKQIQEFHYAWRRADWDKAIGGSPSVRFTPKIPPMAAYFTQPRRWTSIPTTPRDSPP